MALFTFDDINEKKNFDSRETKGSVAYAKLSPEDMILHKFGALKQEQTIHFVTGGVWSLTDLVHYVLKQTGKASLIGYTWSFTAPAAQKVIWMKEQGLIDEMSFVVDYTMSKWSRGAFNLIKPLCANITTTQIHAKGFVIWNDGWKVSCVSSMNFSNNPRIEAGVLSTERGVFDFSKSWVTKALQGGEVLHEERDLIDFAMKMKTDPNDYSKVVFIVRGLPGSGKSALAKQLAEVVCEHDDVFTIGDRYQFEISKMSLAIGSCKAKFMNAIDDGVKRIAVANTFQKEEETEYYINVAKKYGYKVFQVIAQNINDTKNIHEIKEDVIENIRKKFEVTL